MEKEDYLVMENQQYIILDGVIRKIRNLLRTLHLVHQLILEVVTTLESLLINSTQQIF